MTPFHVVEEPLAWRLRSSCLESISVHEIEAQRLVTTQRRKFMTRKCKEITSRKELVNFTRLHAANALTLLFVSALAKYAR